VNTHKQIKMSELKQIRKKKIKEMKQKMDKETETIMDVDDGGFQKKVIEQSKQRPVVVDFWAGWCQPCKMLGPILENAVKENGNVVLAKVNVDKAQQTAAKYGVRSIPTVKLFKDGEIQDGFVGLKSQQAVKQWLQKHS